MNITAGLSFGQRKYASLFLATVLEMAVGSILSISDNAITGNIIGMSGLAAINLVMPLSSVSVFCGNLAGGGSAILYSRALGAFRKEEASRILGTSVLFSAALGLILLLVSWFYLPVFMELTGVDPAVIALAEQYLLFFGVCLLISPFKDLLEILVYTDGGERLSVAASVVDSVGNVVLSIPLAMKFGMPGVSLGTLISNVAALLILLSHCLSPKSSLRPKLCFSFPYIGNMIRHGFNSNTMFLYLAVLGHLCSRIVTKWFGSRYLPFLTLLYALFELNVILECAGEAAQPMISAYLGESNIPAIRSLMDFVLKSNLALGAVLTAVYLLAAPLLPCVFGLDSDPELYALCIRGIRIFSVSCLPLSLLALCDDYWLYIGHLKLAFFSNFLKYFAVSAVLIPVLSGVFGPEGMWLGFGIAHLVSILIIFPWGRAHYGKERFPLLLEEDPDTMDRSLELETGEIMALQEEAGTFLAERGVPKKALNRMMLAIEELLMMAKEREPEKKLYGECFLKKCSDRVQLVVWDSGDPSDLTDEDRDVSSFRGYVISRYMSQNRNRAYVQALGFNRVQLEIPFTDPAQRKKQEEGRTDD